MSPSCQKPLAGKTILVTGAATGIGRAIALACAGAGAGVMLAGLEEALLAQVCRDAEALGTDAAFQCVDVRETQAVEALFCATLARFGTLDGVVANAGILGRKAGFEDLTQGDWRQVIEVNLFGTVNTLMAGARHLVRQGHGGTMLATGSSAALRPVPGLLPYAASKGAIHTLVHALALELAPARIRINLLIPGTTATDATRALPGYLDAVAASLPLGSVVEAEELARLAVFALSDAAPHMTGSHLKIDAGRTL